MANMMSQKSDYLINKWSRRIGLVEKARGGVLNLERRAALANALECTHDRLKYMEATNPSSIGQYKRYALDIVTATVPNLIAFDIYAVQAMDNRIGMINYIDYKYSKAKGATAAGTTFASSINMGKSDPNYTNNVVNGEVVGEGDGTDTTFTATLAWSPIILDSFTVKAGAVVGTSNNSGTISGTGVSGTITATGALSLTYTSAPASGTEIKVSYKFNNEDISSDGPTAAGFTNVPEIELKLNSVPVTAQARTLRSYWAFDAAFELQKEYGQNIETLLATNAAGEIAHEIDNELTLDLLAAADAGPALAWSRSLTPGIALVDHYDSFNVKITEGSNQIFDATRKVKANFMVCGLGVSSVVESMRGFTGSGAAASAIGPHFLGTLASGMKVYVNPDYEKNTFVLGYKGSSMFDAGAFYCPYMPVASTDLIMDANFRGQRGWATMYGKKIINNKMYVKGYITD